jgi:UDP-glucose 4-epimerase
VKNILVTGGAGFIGSHTVVELAAAGYNPIIIDDFSNSERSVLGGLEKIMRRSPMMYEGRFQDTSLLENIFEKENIDGVIHFAANKAVGESVKKPLKYFDNNVSALITFLEFLESKKINNLVFSSSCTVYGQADKLPLTENAPVKPAKSPYGATKQMGEIIINYTSRASETLRSLSLRYFNPIGAHPSAAIGELPLGVPTILVPYITQTVAGWHNELTVFGGDYPTPDGTNIRDYVHVLDLAKAHVKALEFISGKKAGYYDVLNIGTGKGSSVLEVINTFEKAIGRRVPYKIGPRRPGDIVASYADATKAQKMLGWRAEKTLEDALVDAWRWQQTLVR